MSGEDMWDGDGRYIGPAPGASVTPIAAGKRKAKPRPKPEKAPQKATAGDWTELLHRSDKGKLTPNAANTATILRHAPEWSGVLEHDERLGVSRYASAPPVPADLLNPRDVYPRELTDADLVRVQGYLLRSFAFAVGLDAICAAIDMVAAARSRDPVREYLDALAWDGTPRLDTWASTYLGAKASPYTRGVASRWLIAAVARTYRPGCQADHMLVLEGPQGSGKSTALRTLGGEFFSDEVAALGTKDAADGLRGTWIVELAELDAANRAEVTALKAFISRRVDRFRPAYGRRTIEHARRNVFAASTNEQSYSRDATGARRLWPIRTGRIDIAALARDRDQLWAEAVACFRAGATWWPDSALEQLAAGEQDARYQEDAWESVIASYLLALPDPKGRPTLEVTVRELATEKTCLGIDVAKITRGDQARIGQCLQRLGWTTTGNPVHRPRPDKPSERERVRVYTPPNPWPPPDTEGAEDVSKGVSEGARESSALLASDTSDTPDPHVCIEKQGGGHAPPPYSKPAVSGVSACQPANPDFADEGVDYSLGGPRS